MNCLRSALVVVGVWVVVGQPAISDASPVLSAPFVTRSVGETFDVAIGVADVVNLSSFQFDLGFDPEIVELLSFTDLGTDFETAATSGGGVLTGLTGFAVGAPASLLSGVADSIGGSVSGLSPGGSLLFVQFKAIAPGVSPLAFSCLLCQDAFLTDDGQFLSSGFGGLLASDGQISVQPVPEPVTLVLFATGLAAVWPHGRRRWTSVMTGRSGFTGRSW